MQKTRHNLQANSEISLQKATFPGNELPIQILNFETMHALKNNNNLHDAIRAISW